ncbi:inner ear-specific collagen [Platichthys flesus]|uniref:inner ear-specific collagen n=1 Tax=Platichthys flesus TaxID=8260 RepID=UPI002DBEF8C3|nr:inner ear-specific collagen [Platichthys flesus]
MLASPVHLLLMVASLPIVMMMPETISPETWSPPPGPGRLFNLSGDNLTEPPAGSPEAFCQMLLQSTDPVSPEDIPWFCLCTHCQSTQGPKGDRGDRGLPGSPGSPGRRGWTGFRGPPGFVGRSGIKGQKGDEGEKGQHGPQGLVGHKGDQGYKGDKGDQGLAGHPGDHGPKGDDGVCPDTCESSDGPQGPPGLPGPAGTRGLPGTPGVLGPKGNKGDVGDLGPLGAPGLMGDKGDLGPPGECNCTDGEDGSPGHKGEMGNKGEKGAGGTEGKIGLQGNQGDPGQIGMRGPPGPCMPNIQSAFSAGLVSSYPPPNTPVVFSHIIYNVYDNYNPLTGIFTAPVNGTYVFSYHLTVHERVLKVGLFHEFRVVIITTDPKILGTTSHSVVIHLAAWERVWLQVKDETTNGMFAGSETSSTFSGFLLHPDTCEEGFLRDFMPPSQVNEPYLWKEMSETSTASPPTTPAGGGSD